MRVRMNFVNQGDQEVYEGYSKRNEELFHEEMKSSFWSVAKRYLAGKNNREADVYLDLRLDDMDQEIDVWILNSRIANLKLRELEEFEEIKFKVIKY